MSAAHAHASGPDWLEDPFQYNTAFPALLDEFTVLSMNGLANNTRLKFVEFSKLDKQTDIHGRPMLKRERLISMCCSHLHFALMVQRPVFDIEDLITARPHLIDSVDAKGHYPLHLAVMNGDVQVLKTLIDAGSSVNVKTNVQNTPLHLCFQNPEFVAVLIEAGATIEVIVYSFQAAL